MDGIMSGTQALLALGTFAAMLVATRITLTYAHRPDGMINQYGQTQSVMPSGQVDVYGTPIPPQAPVPVPVREEKPLWLVWGQMFIVAELAALLLVGILTGGYGAVAALTGTAG